MKWFLILPLFVLSACAGGTPIDYLRMRDIPPPTIEHFTHCYNYGCEKRATLALPQATKKQIDQIFKPKAKTAQDEQIKIIQALQLFETDIGEIVGTKNDKRGTFRLYQNDSLEAKTFQQDCIDESTNTTTYLTLLNNMGYLKFHTPAFPATRQPFFGGGNWWHQTATMQNVGTGARYAVDTWFEDNGKAGYIVPLKDWEKGWRPEESKPAN